MKRAALLAVLLLANSIRGQGIGFASKPVVRKNGEKAIISFQVSGPTDVAVAIENTDGNVVRHLAAGVLRGKHPPAEPLQAGLAQSLEWDYKDDAGKPAAGGPFRVRVRLGLKPEFDGFLLHNPAATGPVSALTLDRDGNVYLFHKDPTANANVGTNKIKALTRGGKYLRTVKPFAASLSPERLKPLGVFQDKDGQLVPRVHNVMQLSFYPDPLNARGESMPLNSSPVVDGKGRIHWMVLGPAIASLDRDGGVPYPDFIGPRLLAEIKGLRLAEPYKYHFERPSLAVSSDGNWLYFAGFSTGEQRQGQPVPCVFRVSLQTRAKAEVFLGKPGVAGKEKGLLTEPRGLAVADGLLYVADRGSDRVVVFKESDRSVVAEFKIAQPDTVGVAPKSGAIYACCATGKLTARLVKLDRTGRELTQITLPRAGAADDFPHRIAVDASAHPVVIWMPSLPYSPHRLLRIEDAGDKFTTPKDPRDSEPWVEGPRDLSMDRTRGELYVKANGERWFRLEERTGKVRDMVELGKMYPQLNMASHGTQLLAGPDGNLVALSWGSGLWRFDRTGKPLNWPGQNTHRIQLGGIMCFQERHLALPRPDEIWLVANPALVPGKHDSRFTSLNVLGPDGKTRRTAVWQCMIGAMPRLDARGNIYLADMVKPPDRSFPEFFDGKLAPPAKTGTTGGSSFWTSYMYGSIIKFPPLGGAIWYRKNLPPTVAGKPPADLLAKPKLPVRAHIGYDRLAAAELQGALWYRFGFAPYTATSSGSTDTCMCEGSGFDVDPFGRVFFPNLGQFRIEVVDTNNNPITAFGRYGTEDAAGRSIPLAWPNTVAISDTHAYVADTISRRVVRVKLAYAVDATSRVP